MGNRCTPRPGWSATPRRPGWTWRNTWWLRPAAWRTWERAAGGDLVRARLNTHIDAAGQPLSNRDTLRLMGSTGHGEARVAIVQRQLSGGGWSRGLPGPRRLPPAVHRAGLRGQRLRGPGPHGGRGPLRQSQRTAQGPGGNRISASTFLRQSRPHLFVKPTAPVTLARLLFVSSDRTLVWRYSSALTSADGPLFLGAAWTLSCRQ